MESTYRFTPTDHLDGFSRAANAGKRDQYMTHSLGLVYCSGKGNRLGCPKTTWRTTTEPARMYMKKPAAGRAAGSKK
jgi:hypothetical protein